MKKRAPAQALLLVDGYNVVGAWPELQALHDRQGLEESRRRLIEILTNYASVNEFETQIVFDAQYRDLPSSQEIITRFVSVHYTSFNQTADTYIEKSCADFRHDIRKFQQRLIVATSDRAQQLTVVGYGAEWMSTEHLLQDVNLATHHIRQTQQLPQKSSSRFLFNSLDPEAQAKLSQLRFGKKKT